MKKKLFIIVYAIVTIIFVLFQIFKYDLVVAAHEASFGLWIVVGLLDYLMYIFYLALIITSIIYTIKKVSLEKWKAFIPTLICAVILFFGFIFPTTNLYLSCNYYINKDNRIKTIEMFNKETIHAVGMNEYKVSGQTSYTRIIFVQNNDNTSKVMFCAYRGFFAYRVFVYVSDDSGIKSGDFRDELNKQKFENIKKVSKNWYSASIK